MKKEDTLEGSPRKRFKQEHRPAFMQGEVIDLTWTWTVYKYIEIARNIVFETICDFYEQAPAAGPLAGRKRAKICPLTVPRSHGGQETNVYTLWI